MSNSTKQSLEDFLKELGEKRQNWKYPVIVAFDRTTANHVLKQEFIEHYTEGEFIPPLTSEIDLEPGISYHKLLDFCLDEPRLSFENADLSDSRATLLMRTVRGKQIQLSQASGSTRRRVTMLAEATPINGPALVFDVELKGSNTQISEEGEVYFNIALGNNYTFHGGVSKFEMDKLGEHFAIYFASLRPKRIQYTLGKLSNVENSAIKPEKFAIRTHGGPGSKLRNEESFGDGAVVLFVEAEGFDSKTAVPPDENSKLIYLLPDGCSANVLFNSEFIIEALLIPEIRKGGSDLNLLNWSKVEAGSETIKYEAEGLIHTSQLRDHADRWDIGFSQVGFNVRSYGSLIIECKNGKLVVDWKGDIETTVTINRDGDYNSGKCFTHWDMRHEYAIAIDGPIGGRRLAVYRVAEHRDTSSRADNALERVLASNNAVRQKFNEMAHRFLWKYIGELYTAFTNFSPTIDTFIFSSLLFRNSHIALDSAHLPNDATALGQLAPDHNKLTITRSDNTPIDNGETSILSGTALTFKTNPATEGVTWSVRHIPDYEGENPPGTIDSTTGAYSAPAADKFEGSHIKVIVTAKKGTAVSHVLVSVLRTTVNVYPTVMTVNLKTYGDIIGGEMNGQAVNWQVKGLGRIEDNPTPDPLAQSSKRYYAPAEVPEFEEGMPAVDEVMRLDQVVVSNGASSKTVHILLPVETQASYWLKPITAGAGVKLEFWKKRKGQPEEQVPADVTSWYVRVGNGTIEDGVYTPHASKPDEDCIVIVAIDDSQVLTQYASMIVPIPFIDAEQFVSLYESVEASDKARRLRLNQK